jgi:hypothetical protein
MPRMLGAFVNYLGGGIRGSIQSWKYRKWRRSE